MPKELDGQANSYNAWAAYSDSKLANVIFAKAPSAGKGFGKKEANWRAGNHRIWWGSELLVRNQTILVRLIIFA